MREQATYCVKCTKPLSANEQHLYWNRCELCKRKEQLLGDEMPASRPTDFHTKLKP